MSISQMMIAGSSSGRPPKSVTWSTIRFDPLQEGQEQTVTLNYENWDGSAIYWTVVDTANNPIAGQLDTYYGQLNPGNGSGSQSFNFTFLADATTEGTQSYRIFAGSNPGSSDYIYQGIFNVNDSSQPQALYLDVDPASLGTMLGLTGWTDASGKGNNIFVSNGTTSTDNGGVLIFNGTTTYAGDVMNSNLSNSVFGSVTVSAWIKPSTTSTTQTIISKELCYKLRINSDGTVGFAVGSANETSWTYTIYSDPGLVAANTWTHVAAKVDVDYTKLYINGVEVAYGNGLTLVANNQAFNIGTYSNGAGDFFNGRMGEVKLWNYGLSEIDIISNYNNTAERYGLSKKIPLSLEFVENQSDYLEAAGSSDWNLGNTWTIEFYLKANAASATANGGIWGLLNQVGWSATDAIVVALSDNKLVFLSVASQANNDVRYVEPTPNQWTHVAISNDAGTQKVFYNGVEQTRVSGNAGSASYTNGSSPLRIGRLGPANGGTLNGKMALVRISNTAKYSTAFTPTTTYGVEADTRLFLPLGAPLVDISNFALNGVAVFANNGGTLYFAKSTYPNLDKQIQVGYTVVSISPSLSAAVTAAVYTADPANWGVNVSPSMGGATTVNFSGTGRHSITNSGVTLNTDFPGPAAGGTGSPGTGQLSSYAGHTVTLTPSTNGSGTPGTAYIGDTITWTITSDSALAGATVYWWVDYDRAPASTWVSGANNGTVSLDANGGGTFTRTVAQNKGVLFRVYIGTTLYQGTVTHGDIGV